jgi:hypothetical protein
MSSAEDCRLNGAVRRVYGILQQTFSLEKDRHLIAMPLHNLIRKGKLFQETCVSQATLVNVVPAMAIQTWTTRDLVNMRERMARWLGG